jgi:hypothetical protein
MPLGAATLLPLPSAPLPQTLHLNPPQTDHLVAHPLVPFVSFTGSVQNGKRVEKTAALAAADAQGPAVFKQCLWQRRRRRWRGNRSRGPKVQSALERERERDCSTIPRGLIQVSEGGVAFFSLGCHLGTEGRGRRVAAPRGILWSAGG